ncbi:MAG: gamma-glutamylcyclotransferase [Burkholderiaceae bacterium]
MAKLHAMDLTPELVALVHRPIPDSGPDPERQPLTDEDYDELVTALLARRPPDSAVWIFAFGSLLWKPGFAHVEELPGRLVGWHRSFCFSQKRFRGTPDCPGLMLSLDRGGECRGLLLRFNEESLERELHSLFRREMTLKPLNHAPRWVRVRTPQGNVTAFTFVSNRLSPSYVRKLPPERVADVLAVACGHAGSGAAYLYETVTRLRAIGIEDRGLWQLQSLVADRIKRSRSTPPVTPSSAG